MLALPVMGRIKSAVLWRLVGNEWAHRSGNLRCVREVFLAMLTGYPRTGIVFGYRAAHTAGVGRRVFALIDTRSRMEDGTESVEGSDYRAGRGEDEFPLRQR